MATSNLTENVVGIDEAVKASAGDTAGFLDAKVDAVTINVVANQLVRAALTGDVTTVGNAATVVGGNADTVTTNADLTGIVTSTGNATAIADGDVPIAKLADGTDGELLTWDASGVIDTVAVGAADDVLTSNGVGLSPTFQTPSGGGGSIEMFNTTGTWTVPAGVHFVELTMVGGGGGGRGANSSTGRPGGGGGATLSRHIIEVTPAGNHLITVGAGGAGGGPSDGAGTDGGDTIFALADDIGTLTVEGGKAGGGVGVNTGGLGGASQTRVLDAVTVTRGGLLAEIIGGGVGGNTAGTPGSIGGSGGASWLGGVGGLRGDNTASPGEGIGAGGGGGGDNQGAGAAGTDGIVILKYSVDGTPS